MRVIYSGVHREVYVAECPDLTIERDEPVEVPDDVAKRLLDSPDWTEAKAPKSADKGGK